MDFCKPYPDRLVPIAHVSVRDVDEGVKELERVAGDGMRGGFISPAPVNGIRYGHDYYDPFWAAAQDLNMPITLHVALNPQYVGSNYYSDDPGLAPELFVESMPFGDPFIGFTNLMAEGVFEKFSNLRIVMVEIGATWIAHWLDILDFRSGRFDFESNLRMKPSEYFTRQCWISAEPIEKGIGVVAQIVGVDRFTWGLRLASPRGPHRPCAKGQGEYRQSSRGRPATDPRRKRPGPLPDGHPSPDRRIASRLVIPPIEEGTDRKLGPA